MTDKKKTQELGETELDEVRGGGDTVPTESISLNYEKIRATDDGKSIKDGSSNTFFIGESSN